MRFAPLAVPIVVALLGCSNPNAGSRAAREREAKVSEAMLKKASGAGNLLRSGIAESNLGRHEIAVERFRAALQAQPDLVEARRQLCLEFVILRRWEEAVIVCNVAAATDSEPAFARNGLRYATRAAVLEAEGRPDEARIALGLRFYANSAPRPAIAIWELIGEESPYYAAAQANISAAAIVEGDFRRAKDAIETAIRLDPANELYRNNAKWLETAAAQAATGK